MDISDLVLHFASQNIDAKWINDHDVSVVLIGGYSYIVLVSIS